MDAALWSPDVEVLKVLLDSKAQINAADEDGFTALMFAAGKGRSDKVRFLVEGGAHINAINVRGLNALGMAAERNHRSVVEFLRKRGAAYDIHSAAAVGDMEELKRYASAGGDVDSREKEYGRSLLWMAAHNGHLEAVEWLLDRKADMKARGPNGETPLHAAAESGHRNVVALLLDSGADIQACSEGMGGTALHVACLYGHPETVELLLSRGSDLEARTKAHGEPPLMIASGSGKTDVVKLLLKQEADADAVDGKGRTALMKAAAVLETDTVKALVYAGANVHGKDHEYGYTPLHHACCIEGCSEEAVRIAELLIGKGAKANKPDSEGTTPLDCAAASGREDLTTVLVNAKGGARLSRVELEKAVMYCASEGFFNEKVASLLLKAGASVNCTDAEGYTPLMHSVEPGNVPAVRFFVSKGADTSIRNTEGETASDMALRRGLKEISEVLRSGERK